MMRCDHLSRGISKASLNMDLMSACKQESTKSTRFKKKKHLCFKTTNNRVQTSKPQAPKFCPKCKWEYSMTKGECEDTCVWKCCGRVGGTSWDFKSLYLNYLISSFCSCRQVEVQHLEPLSVVFQALINLPKCETGRLKHGPPSARELIAPQMSISINV